MGGIPYLWQANAMPKHKKRIAMLLGYSLFVCKEKNKNKISKINWLTKFFCEGLQRLLLK
jgi:hypothetical protein